MHAVFQAVLLEIVLVKKQDVRGKQLRDEDCVQFAVLRSILPELRPAIARQLGPRVPLIAHGTQPLLQDLRVLLQRVLQSRFPADVHSGVNKGAAEEKIAVEIVDPCLLSQRIADVIIRPPGNGSNASHAAVRCALLGDVHAPQECLDLPLPLRGVEGGLDGRDFLPGLHGESNGGRIVPVRVVKGHRGRDAGQVPGLRGDLPGPAHPTGDQNGELPGAHPLPLGKIQACHHWCGVPLDFGLCPFVGLPRALQPRGLQQRHQRLFIKIRIVRCSEGGGEQRCLRAVLHRQQQIGEVHGEAEDLDAFFYNSANRFLPQVQKLIAPARGIDRDAGANHKTALCLLHFRTGPGFIGLLGGVVLPHQGLGYSPELGRHFLPHGRGCELRLIRLEVDDCVLLKPVDAPEDLFFIIRCKNAVPITGGRGLVVQDIVFAVVILRISRAKGKHQAQSV